MTPKLILVTACAVLLSACSESNNLLLGTVSTNLDSHRVVVTDCYRTEVPPPEHFVESGVRAWRYAPCRDAVIEIHGDKLNVNGAILWTHRPHRCHPRRPRRRLHSAPHLPTR